MSVVRLVFRYYDYPILNLNRLRSFLFSGTFLLCIAVSGNPVLLMHNGEQNPENDTVFIPKGHYILLKNTTIVIPRDTFYIVHHRQKTGDSGAYKNSQVFYDTVYKKLTRTKFTQLLYYLAFVPPTQSDLPDTIQVVKSSTPFEEFSGKVIRNISIKVLPPFGANIYDTGRLTETGIGRALNSVHMNTRKYVVRKNLLFKKGDLLNPDLLADNERLLRNMSAVDNARIIIARTEPDGDSVDMMIVVKDVWSIGLDVPLVTTDKVRFRIYDANFLGLGDKLTTSMSLGLYRAPFYFFEGVSYTYSNIGGSLIDGSVGYSADDDGNNILLFSLGRPFVTNLTKWAGSTTVLWETYIHKANETTNIKSTFNTQGIWLGRAFLLNGQKKASRAVVAVAFYRNQYTKRPPVTIDSIGTYNDGMQFLTTFSFSRNNYYLTDYVLNFGKIENLPYGHLFQLTIGVDHKNSYSRLYSGINLSMGNFFNKFGYISAYVKMGGFFDHGSFEDAVFKFNIHYFTPLLKSRDKRYKFRAFYSADYRHAINILDKNLTIYDANQIFNIKNLPSEDYYNGVNILSGRLSTVCFTPWYFYGFHIGLMIEMQAGLVAKRNEPVIHAPAFSSVGMSLIIKNDNLIFPAFIVSANFYPSWLGNPRQLQFMVSSNLNINYYDFNVTAPHQENLGN